MNKNYQETLKNAQAYYTAGDHNYVARFLDGRGYMADIYTSTRTYHIVTKIIEHGELVTMEISPEIHCISSDTLNMTCEYSNKINSIHTRGSIIVEKNGHLYAHINQSFKDTPVSPELFKDMEYTLMAMFEMFCNVLEKVAVGRLLNSQEADPKDVIFSNEKNALLEKMRKSRQQHNSLLSALSDEDDEDDLDSFCKEMINGEVAENNNDEDDLGLSKLIARFRKEKANREDDATETKTEIKENSIISKIRKQMKSSTKSNVTLEGEEKTGDASNTTKEE